MIISFYVLSCALIIIALTFLLEIKLITNINKIKKRLDLRCAIHVVGFENNELFNISYDDSDSSKLDDSEIIYPSCWVLV